MHYDNFDCTSQVVVQQESPPQNVKCNDTVTPEKAAYTVSSEAIFSIYAIHAQKLDEDNAVEIWKVVADGVLIFAGLFSATVAVFIAISYPNLQQDPNIITQSLTQISQQFSNETFDDASGVSNTSTLSSFIPPGSVVFIWVLGLVVNFMALTVKNSNTSFNITYSG
ncbi:hypothetical protein EDB89DRAFT_2068466 [Lactarius sanguifluus]|nr:hypothetical protein EDB89DRAFT_2068466 [Lactarius sanguifluus]